MSEIDIPVVRIIQSVAILIDGNNIERSLHSMTGDDNVMINFDNLIPKLLRGRGLSRLIYFREGNQISSKLANRLLTNYMGSVVPCHKSADIPLSISATQIARKVDTIIILSGDSDYVELLRHLKGEGVRIEIAAVKATTAQILVDEADHFVEISEEDSFSLGPKRSNSNKRSSSKSSSSRSKNSNSSRSSNSKDTSTRSSGNKDSNPKESTNKEVKPETPATKFVEKAMQKKAEKPKRATGRNTKGKSPSSSNQQKQEQHKSELVKKKETKENRKSTRKQSNKKADEPVTKTAKKKQATRKPAAKKTTRKPVTNKNTPKKVPAVRNPQKRARPTAREMGDDDLSY